MLHYNSLDKKRRSDIYLSEKDNYNKKVMSELGIVLKYNEYGTEVNFSVRGKSYDYYGAQETHKQYLGRIERERAKEKKEYTIRFNQRELDEIDLILETDSILLFN